MLTRAAGPKTRGDGSEKQRGLERDDGSANAGHRFSLKTAHLGSQPVSLNNDAALMRLSTSGREARVNEH